MTDAGSSSLFSWLFGRRKEDRPSRQAHASRVPVVPPSEPANAAERALLAEGKTILAVKAYRERTGADLVSAKRAIDAARAPGPRAVGRPGTWPASPSTTAHEVPLTPEETALVRQNRIRAIKTVRQRTGLGLKEAKDLVDAALQDAGA